MTSLVLALAAAAALLGACATSYQSARVVEPGKVQVTGALAHTEGGPTSSYGGWRTLGDLQVRAGIVDRVDAGLRFVRSPGTSYRSYATLDAKVELVPDRVSLSLPVGLVWYQEGDRIDRVSTVLSPGVLAGYQLKPNLELVGAPRLFLFLPGPYNDVTEVEVGGSVGLRFTNPARTWAIHPELGILHLNQQNEGYTFVTVGLGLSVGN